MVKKIEVSKGELLKMMNEELSKHAECEDCKFQSVMMLRNADKSRCNWSRFVIVRSSGRDLGPCRGIASKIITKFRNKYNIKKIE